MEREKYNVEISAHFMSKRLSAKVGEKMKACPGGF